MYYSHSISARWVVRNVEPGLACVAKYQDVYHRAVIEETYSSHCVVRYIDLGAKERIQYGQSQLKYLLNYFANTPSLAILCRLANIEFKKIENQLPQSTYEELQDLCQGGPFPIRFHSEDVGVWQVEIFQSNQRCLNDIVVAKGLAVGRMFTPPSFTHFPFSQINTTGQYSKYVMPCDEFTEIGFF